MTPTNNQLLCVYLQPTRLLFSAAPCQPSKKNNAYYETVLEKLCRLESQIDRLQERSNKRRLHRSFSKTTSFFQGAGLITAFFHLVRFFPK